MSVQAHRLLTLRMTAFSDLRPGGDEAAGRHDWIGTAGHLI